MSDVSEVAPDHPRARALLAAYFEELRERFGSFEAPSLDELRADAVRGVVLVAHDDDGVPVGCGSLRLLEAGTGEVKRMFVVASARGQGHARRLLQALEERARAMGCRRVVLDTAAPLVEAARMYLREGYVEIARYNANPYAARWFEKSLL